MTAWKAIPLLAACLQQLRCDADRDLGRIVAADGKSNRAFEFHRFPCDSLFRQFLAQHRGFGFAADHAQERKVSFGFEDPFQHRKVASVSACHAQYKAIVVKLIDMRGRIIRLD